MANQHADTKYRPAEMIYQSAEMVYQLAETINQPVEMAYQHGYIISATDQAILYSNIYYIYI